MIKYLAHLIRRWISGHGHLRCPSCVRKDNSEPWKCQRNLSVASSPVNLAPVTNFLLARFIGKLKVGRTHAAPQKSVPVPQKLASWSLVSCISAVVEVLGVLTSRTTQATSTLLVHDGTAILRSRSSAVWCWRSGWNWALVTSTVARLTTGTTVVGLSLLLYRIYYQLCTHTRCKLALSYPIFRPTVTIARLFQEGCQRVRHYEGKQVWTYAATVIKSSGTSTRAWNTARTCTTDIDRRDGRRKGPSVCCCGGSTTTATTACTLIFQDPIRRV